MLMVVLKCWDSMIHESVWSSSFSKWSCDGVVYGTHFILSYILKGEDRPRCIGCDEDITVKHILLDCVDF